MSSPFTTALTLLAALLHGAFGCCWHHGHTGSSDDCRAASVAIEESSHRAHCDSHRHADASTTNRESSPDDSDNDHEGCDESRCVYLTSKTWTCTTPDLVTLAAATTAITPVTRDFHAVDRLDSPPDPIVPHRHRALLQVWLI
jgi:hypothetical protein